VSKNFDFDFLKWQIWKNYESPRALCANGGRSIL
jgi:hypothetical protein